ncbi:50S ribosomal protein L15 [Phosphitispora fastidiosa]|uniref:50S ribosomal protein L15 n=1 Tax=Phosphitispora fastidiosa TaxID=2837202 RepID=UPI001E3B0546|nr:50S ribosomal protein L15 [Phosphitispora fastidiosa]MBU7007444.1 large subunit ribosomal protein L15 [Phosphitispora fastidiosa]
MELHNLKPAKGARKQPTRKGRGLGTGLGKTAGRGHKGQNARSGSGGKVGFEGGQKPLIQRVPKRGFHNKWGKEYAEINVAALNKFDNGFTVTEEGLKQAGIVKNIKNGVKILGKGNLEKSLNVQVRAFSKSAVEKITAAGGKAEVI